MPVVNPGYRISRILAIRSSGLRETHIIDTYTMSIKIKTQKEKEPWALLGLCS